MKIEQVKRQYKDEWVLAEVLEKDKLGEPVKVKVIAHSKRRADTYRAMSQTKAKYLYHFYNGNIPKKGYAVAFYGAV